MLLTPCKVYELTNLFVIYGIHSSKIILCIIWVVFLDSIFYCGHYKVYPYLKHKLRAVVQLIGRHVFLTCI